MFQCYSPGCLQIWATLTQEQRKEEYCSHIKEADFALKKEQFASQHSAKLEDLKKLNLSDKDFNKLQGESKQGHITVYSAPGKNIIVPSLSAITHNCPLPYIHLRNNACPLPSCKASRSKQHSLAKKDGVLCIHILLGKVQKY